MTRGFTLEEATQTYDAAGSGTLEMEFLRHESFDRFAALLDILRRKTDAGNDVSDWDFLVRPLRRYEWIHALTPIPFNSPPDGGLAGLAELDTRINRLASSYPHEVEAARELLMTFKELIRSNEQPTLLRIRELAGKYRGGSLGVLLQSRKLVAESESFLRRHGGIPLPTLVTAGELSRLPPFDALVVIGNPGLYPSHVYKAPDARQIHWFQWERYSEDVDREPDLCAAASQQWGKFRLANTLKSQVRIPSRQGPPLSSLDFGISNAQKLISRLSTDEEWLEEQTTPDAEEWVDARIYMLEGEHYTALPDDPKDTHLVLDLDEDDPVLRLAISDIQPGIFLLIRPDGERDYVESLADSILAEHAERLRGIQHEWKEALHAKVALIGIQDAVKQLSELGAPRASEANLRHWLKPRNIKTRDPEDFKALLRFAGLDQNIDLIWKSMCTIESAHRRAGMKLRSLLIEQVRKADLKSLVASGEATFSVPDVPGGKLKAYRVIEVADQSVRVRQSHLGKLRQAELDKWPG